MANQVYGSAASSSIPSDWIRRFRSYQSHMSGDIFLFLSLSPLPIKDSVNIADGTLLPVPHRGSMSSSRILHDKFYFSSLRTNLLSVSHLAANHLRVIFSSSECLIQDQRTGRIVGRLGKLYYLDILLYIPFFFSCFSRIRNGTRRRLGHTQHTVQDFFHCLEYIPAFHSDGLNNSCDCLQLAIVCSRIKHKNPNSSVPFFGLIHSLVSTCDLTLFDLRLI